jgi:hypothetical protein
MKWIGLLSVIALVICCFFPWVFIESKNITVSGIDAAGTSFGKPGYFHFLLGAVYVVFHFIPSIWAKRSNLLIASLNIAWALRNYFIISACSGGECPVKKPALYLMFFASLLMLVDAMFPQVKLQEKK